MARREAELVSSVSLTPSYDSAKSSPLRGQEPAIFKLSQHDGSVVDLNSFKGRPLLINFWASWCPPCVEEYPSLLELASIGSKKWGLVILAISEDTSWEPIQNMFAAQGWKRPDRKGFWSFKQLPLKILLDPRSEVANIYGSQKYPETYFIGRDFKIKRKFIGPQDWTSKELMEWMSQNL